MLYNENEVLWVEKYRPHKIEDCILPADTKNTFQEFVNRGTIPNLLLTGSAGTGKTTVARAMLEQIGADYIVINGSLNRNIDTLRNEVQSYASTVSLSGGRKYVIFDEADGLNPTTQNALRAFIEEFSQNVSFIFTCNFRDKIIEPIHSRCSVIEFRISKNDKPQLAMQLFKRIQEILKNENIEYDKQVIVEVISRYYPDNRRILNELQRYSVSGKIDSGILANNSDASIGKLFTLLKDNNVSGVRTWVGENSDIDNHTIYRHLYNKSSEYFTPVTIVQMIPLIAKYQYQDAFVADKEINLAAFLSELMIIAEYI